MSQISERFSVATFPQEIPRALLAEIEGFIRVFDRVTSRPSWRAAAIASAPEIAHSERSEVCFFGAWDFHLPPEQSGGWQLIEFNDNGSGFLFAGLINRLFWEIFELSRVGRLEPPPSFSALTERVLGMIERETREFFGGMPEGLLLILDDADSLERGRFRDELVLLRDLLHRSGRSAEIAAPGELHWNGRGLLLGSREATFIVNRSTDFFFESEAFAPLRAAYREGRVYVAPNPFSYATRSDKALLPFLSRPDWDARLEIRPEERMVLTAHVPATRLVSEENVGEIVARREELVLKPTHGYAGRGLLDRAQVGRSRLRRLLRSGTSYVAQQRVPKARLALMAEGSPVVYSDLRVWAYRGECFLVSGRASRHPDRIDLSPPGGWLPTYVRTA